MEVNQRCIIGITLLAISVILMSTLAIAAAEPSTSVEGTLYAAAPRVQHASPEPENAKLQTRSSSNLVPVRDLQADRAVSGSEPDPETFDKVGLERWWSKHQKATK